MAELSTADRQRIGRGLRRYWSSVWTVIGANKSEVQTTVNETDAWIDMAQSNYVSSLTYGGQFTGTQLTLIFCCVAVMRVAPGTSDWIQRLLGIATD